MRCPRGSCLAVVSAVLLSLGAGILGWTATRGEAAPPPKRPTTFSTTLTPTLADPAPTFLTPLDNGLVVSGQCHLLPASPFIEVFLELAPGNAPAMLVSGFSFVGTTPTVQSGFKGAALQLTTTLAGGGVAFALIAGPSDLDGNLLGSVFRIDIQGTFSAGPGPVFQCSFWGVIVPSG